MKLGALIAYLAVTSSRVVAEIFSERPPVDESSGEVSSLVLSILILASAITIFVRPLVGVISSAILLAVVIYWTANLLFSFPVLFRSPIHVTTLATHLCFFAIALMALRDIIQSRRKEK